MPLGAFVVKEIASVAITAATPATVWTPAAGKKIRLMGYRLGVTVAAAAIIFKEGAGATAINVRTPVLAINGTDGCDAIGQQGVALSAADNVLKLDVTVSATVTGFVFGYEE